MVTMQRPIEPPAGGFTYIGVMFAIVLAGIAIALTAEVWRTTSQRAKEEQLLFAGGQIVQAIRNFYLNTPGTARQLPRSLDQLLQDPRTPDVRRYLRKIFSDPMTGKADWILVRSSGGGIAGVYSASDERALRRTPALVGGIEVGGEKYSDWRFVYVAGDSGGNAAPPVNAGSAGMRAAPATVQQDAVAPVPAPVAARRSGAP